MYHQWFNSREYGEKEKALIEAIKNLGPKSQPYGEQNDYEQKMHQLKVKFLEYTLFCEKGHEQEINNNKKMQFSLFKNQNKDIEK